MELKRRVHQKNNNGQTQQTDLLEIVYYTDPLCCWSWAFEPQWRRLLYEFKGKIKYRYCMGGLLPSWHNYNDTLNSVTRPIQMGPVWMHARQLSGMPIEQNIWMMDPPSSSYPACMAVKSAGVQSSQFEELYLRKLREAVMMRSENISKREVIVNIAESLAHTYKDFSIDKFRDDLKSDELIEAFRKDLQEVKYHNINRFPSLVIKNAKNKAILIAGYRPYSMLMDGIKQLTSVGKTEKISTSEYKKYWSSATKRELQEIRNT